MKFTRLVIEIIRWSIVAACLTFSGTLIWRYVIPGYIQVLKHWH